MKVYKYLFFLCLWPLPALVEAQIIVLDPSSGVPITFAQVLDGKGAIVGCTDEKGMFPPVEKYPLIEVEHLGYECLQVKTQGLKGGDTLYMKPVAYDMGEVAVSAPHRDYICLTGYFRCYQLNDSCPKYFTEGLAEYYIPLNGKRPETRTEVSITLCNRSLIERERNRSFELGDRHLFVPYFYGKVLPQQLKEECVMRDTAGVTLLLNHGAEAGLLWVDTLSHVCRVNYNVLAGEREKRLSLFGYTQRLTTQIQEQTLKQKEDDGYSYMDLLNQKGYRKLFYRYKKDSTEQMIEVVDEIYIYGRSYLTKQEMKERKQATLYAGDTSSIERYKLTHRVPAMSPSLERLVQEMSPEK